MRTSRCPHPAPCARLHERIPAVLLAAPVSSYKIVAQFPHSTNSYTEGFFYRDGLFYEGTGLKGSSAILVIEPESGKVLQRRSLPEEYFGEGIIDWGPGIYEWTWQSHICFVYDRFSLRPVRQFSYSGEGWGMTRTAHRIITSDGTSTLRFRNPNTFKETRHIVVKDGKVRSNNSTNSSMSKERFTRTSGTRIALPASRRKMDTSSAGSISPA